MLGLIPYIGPLFFDGAHGGGGEGSGDGSSSGAGSTGDDSGGSGAPGSATSGSSADDKEPMIPKNRFDEVNREYQKLKKADEERAAKDLAARGEHEKIAAGEKARADRAELAAKRAAIGAEFASKAAGKVVDISAAAKLADFSDIDVTFDDDGQATVKGDVGALVEATLKAYPFLKAGAQTTGGGMGGPVAGAGQNPPDVSKMSADEKMRVGLEQEIGKLPPSRAGAFAKTGSGS